MKPQSSETKSATTRIPPVIQTPPVRDYDQLVIAASDVLVEAISRNHTEMTVNVIRDGAAEYLRKFSPATVSRIESHAWTPRSALMLCNGLFENWNETKVNDCVALSAALNLQDDMAVHERHLNAYDQHAYPDLCPPDNYGDYPEERLSQITALYHVTDYMGDLEDEDIRAYDRVRGVDMWYISDPELQSFILTPGEYKREDIVDTIRDHGTLDVGRIKEIINTGTKSLGSGVL
jgi:hypothetical protein